MNGVHRRLNVRKAFILTVGFRELKHTFINIHYEIDINFKLIEAFCMQYPCAFASIGVNSDSDDDSFLNMFPVF